MPKYEYHGKIHYLKTDSKAWCGKEVHYTVSDVRFTYSSDQVTCEQCKFFWKLSEKKSRLTKHQENKIMHLAWEILLINHQAEYAQIYSQKTHTKTSARRVIIEKYYSEFVALKNEIREQMRHAQ